MVDESPFTVRDRRRSQEEPTPSHPPHSPPPPASPPPSSARVQTDHDHENRHPSPQPATLSELILSLGTSAFAALGVRPATGEPTGAGASADQLPHDLEQARHLIDLLGVLEQKTAGNLTSDEQQLLQQLLYTLRLTFVEQNRSGPPASHGGVR
ncbi:MAG TPA: DUF1844 domain-containing protein [Nitrospiria bacterium]|nr:DUF1844 domain-containing protein [Nitrospiria bacterium]